MRVDLQFFRVISCEQGDLCEVFRSRVDIDRCIGKEEYFILHNHDIDAGCACRAKGSMMNLQSGANDLGIIMDQT